MGFVASLQKLFRKGPIEPREAISTTQPKTESQSRPSSRRELSSSSQQIKLLINRKENKKSKLRPQAKKDASRRIGIAHLTENDYEYARSQLKEQWNHEPSHADIIWAALNIAVMQTTDLYTLGWIYFEKALFLHCEGRDSYNARRMVMEIDLRMYEQTGIVKKVRIMANTGCDICKPQHDRVLTIKQALKTMPLPCKGCTTKLYGGDGDYGYCRCTYLAELDY